MTRFIELHWVTVDFEVKDAAEGDNFWLVLGPSELEPTAEQQLIPAWHVMDRSSHGKVPIEPLSRAGRGCAVAGQPGPGVCGYLYPPRPAAEGGWVAQKAIARALQDDSACLPMVRCT